MPSQPTPSQMIDFDTEACRLLTPTAMPLAAGFLWNRKMMVHATARGFVTAQFMQPEPSKYARGPILEAKHFMLPEQGTYAHHPGRFLYVKDRDNGALFSHPYEPVRAAPERFEFRQERAKLTWESSHHSLDIKTSLVLPVDDACELWSLNISNKGPARRISLYVFFPLGFISWMNQSAAFNTDLGGIVADSVTPYQKIPDYFKNRDLKDQTYLLSTQLPTAHETRQAVFEGEGGLHNPSMIAANTLSGGTALYENPAAILQFDIDLDANASWSNFLIFGPAKDAAEIREMKEKYLGSDAFAAAERHSAAYLAEGAGVVSIATPDTHLDTFVNTWLPRQVFYHGDTNRLTTDPQTRNFLQDAMGSVYVKPQTARQALLKALSQQHDNGAMPDGITMYEGAELKYINQVPHTDHCVWLPILLQAYLDETDDYAVLDVEVNEKPVRQRLSAAMQWLINSVDHRGLNYIEQGDWNDPMNMVGWKGKGVSGWLSLASAYALRLWAGILSADGQDGAPWLEAAEKFNAAMRTHLWDTDWFGRGITDENRPFGIRSDTEGSIYLNPQSFAFLSGASDAAMQTRTRAAVEARLESPYGVEMIAPAYTHMHEDIGRLTQKFPGVAENGSVYNHAAIFYIYSLYHIGQSAKAFELLRRMLPGPDADDYQRRGQMPVFVPNYYRGASRQFPEAAGRSSHLFNTGTASWLYRSVIEGLFGLRGCRDGLRIAPQLPPHWPEARAVRMFRGARFDITIRTAKDPLLVCNGSVVEDWIIRDIAPGKTYKVEATMPGR